MFIFELFTFYTYVLISGKIKENLLTVVAFRAWEWGVGGEGGFSLSN